jgi:hypothetical protein
MLLKEKRHEAALLPEVQGSLLFRRRYSTKADCQLIGPSVGEFKYAFQLSRNPSQISIFSGRE